MTMRREVITMFGQVVQGHTEDPAGLREAMERWMHDLSPRAKGWLGTAAGVTQDGTFIAVVRFDSKVAARTNSDRPEQDQWWVETSRLLEGEVTVRDGVRTEAYRPGDPDQARFVQVVQGRVSDLDRARRSLHALQEALKVHLPCLLGSVTIEYDAGGLTRALYFSTEEQARAGERNMPPVVRARDQEARQLVVGPVEFLDLREPWLYAAR
jgi:hypothetical protein